MVKRVMNPKKVVEGVYISGEFEVDETNYEITDGFIYISKSIGEFSKEYNTGMMHDVITYELHNLRANAYKMRNIRKFFAVLSNEWGKEYTKEHRNDLRELIGKINSEIFTIVTENGGSKESVINITVTVGKTEEDKPDIRYITVEISNPIKKYKLVKEE